MNLINKDAESRKPRANQESPNPVKSVIIRLSDNKGKKRFAINFDNSNRRYKSRFRNKWGNWFKYWPF